MDLLPDISMPPEVKEDLEIIETEDLKSDPFVRAPPIKPEQPKAEPKKAKRQVSEKQKAHLANARKLAKERKEKAKKEKEEEEKKQDIKEYAQVINAETDAGTAPSTAPNGFEQWLGYYNQFADIQKAQQEQERKQREEQERKEKELEAKYFAKFQKQYNLDQQQKDVMEKEQPRRLPKTSLDILAPPQQKEDFGPFASYF